MSLLLFDAGIPGGTTSVIAGVGLFFILVAAAYVMFRFMRKTVKMAFRMAMVVTVLFTFVVGGIAVYWFGTGTSSKPRRPQRVQPR
jgi:tetrahydromethanopterin S-methyltransferase subunit D